MKTLTIFQQLARRWSVMNYVHISLLDDAIRAGLARPDEEKNRRLHVSKSGSPRALIILVTTDGVQNWPPPLYRSYLYSLQYSVQYSM